MSIDQYYELSEDNQRKVDDLMDESNKSLEAIEFTDVQSKLRSNIISSFVIGGTLSVLISSGKNWGYESFQEMIYKTGVANDLLDNNFDMMDENDVELCFSTFLADSSDLCINYQNKIYGVHKEIDGFPNIDDALFRNGGGLIHPNCRHHIDPYFPGITDLPEGISDEKIQKNQQKRDEFVYCDRNYRKYKEKERIANYSNINSEHYKNLSDEWKKRRDLIKVPNDLQFLV